MGNKVKSSPVLILILAVTLVALAAGLAAVFQQPTVNAEAQAQAATPQKLHNAFAAPVPVTIPAGTPIVVRLQNTVSSRRSRPGDHFEAIVAQPVVVNGKAVIPKNANIRGRVIDARPSGRLHHPGHIALALQSVEVGGKWYEMQSSSMARTGRSHKRRNLAFIGGGSGLGAAIGAIATGGTGALIGAGAGAGAGTLGAALTGRKDVSYPVESVLTFRLRQAVTLRTRG